MGLLGHRLHEWEVLSRLDDRVAGHFESAFRSIAGRRQQLRWELYEVGQAFRQAPYRLVLLKGAAYEIMGLPPAGARIVSDIDVLVPVEWLGDAEARLRRGGWLARPLDEYDERYYRQWSHELPPFSHPERGIEVDLHHSISPDRRGARIPIERVLADCAHASWLGGCTFDLLQPVDQLLHAAVHTFIDSDLDMRVREVMVFDLLYRHYAGNSADLPERLVDRALEFGRGGVLWWALHFSRRWLGTPVEPSTLDALPRPGPLATSTMNLLADRAMLPGAHGERRGFDRLAAVALLARYHWNRLPLARLIPHVLEKSRRRLFQRPREPDAP